MSLDIGARAERGFGPVTRTDIVRYAGASGDLNPIHHDEPLAQAAGLPSVMAHGMLSAGYLASLVTGWFGAGSMRAFQVRFREPVWPGDRLTAQGVVASLGDGTAALDLRLVNQSGAAVVTGRAVVATGAAAQPRNASPPTAKESCGG